MKKNMMIIWVLIVLVVVVGLVYITINTKKEVSENNNVSLESGAVAGDMVTVNYTGKLADGTVFDSNVDPKFGHVEPFTFPLGAGQVIPGWDKGLVGMKIGDKKTLVIPPEDAYGATGAGGVIPPNATLTFDVEVTNITSGATE